MALDRQTIEKRDFPIGRRGYEPEAVDAHLARVAEEVEQLRRRASSGGGGPVTSSPASLAKAASEQVRAIVEAAESSAAAIEQNAQEAAERIREEAEADARQTRDDAVGQSQEHVGKVRQSTTQMLQRVEAMESELSGLVESLRTGANRLTADLSLLEGGMGDLYDAAGRERPSAGPRVVESVPLAIVADERGREPEAEAEPRLAAVADEVAPLAGEPAVAEPADASVAAASADSADVDGARLVALNMALNGTPRDDTDQYLADNFDLPDRAGLLDEVYATVES
jgi:DivIVA domain-containing protein